MGRSPGVLQSEGGCQPKRNMSMRRGPVPPPRATATWMRLPGIRGTAEAHPTKWGRNWQMPSGCTICWGTRGNGSRTGMGSTPPPPRAIHPGPRAAISKSRKAVRGAPLQSPCAHRTVTLSCQATVAISWACAASRAELTYKSSALASPWSGLTVSSRPRLGNHVGFRGHKKLQQGSRPD